MRKFIAVGLFIIGLALAGFAYSSYSEYTTANNIARFYRENPNEIPASENREERIADELMSADRNRNLALSSGAGSLLLCIGGAALLISGMGKSASVAAPGGESNEDSARRSQAMKQWARVAFTRPVEVHYSRLHPALFAFVMIFFISITALVIVANGFTGVSILLLALNVIFLCILYVILSRARRKSAHLFDSSGVTRGDKRRFDWSDCKSVDYLMAFKPRSGREYLWRIEIAFNGGEAWIIPQRVQNLEEVNNLIASLPVGHQKRRA